MTTIQDMLARVERVKVEQIAASAIEETAYLYEDLNAQQMDAGLTGEGDDIKPFYTPLTVMIKESKGQPADRVTLKDTGEFHRRIEAKVVGSVIRIQSTDEKAAELEDKYGKEIYGLGGEFKEEYLTVLEPATVDALKKEVL